MSERAGFRGGRGGGGAGGGRGGYNQRGGGGSGASFRGGSHSSSQGGSSASGTASGSDRDKPKRESIIDLNKYMDKEICVKFSGGREVTGILKGYDQLMNLVLDDVKEVMRGQDICSCMCFMRNQVTNSIALQMTRATKQFVRLV
ncbi:Sm-like protein lsm7 [Ascosphaera aggregata]|nr:Sm-like protein lsm7 [Ascosphaera aggregata]